MGSVNGNLAERVQQGVAALAAVPLPAVLAPLRGPLPAPAAPPFILTLLYLTLCALSFIAWRRRGRTGSVGTGALPAGATQTLPLLEEIAARFEAGQFSPEELCPVLASLARVRLAQRTGLPASRLTSSQLLEQAEASGLLTPLELEQAAELFQLCDRVRSAARIPDGERARRSLELAWTLFPPPGGRREVPRPAVGPAGALPGPARTGTPAFVRRASPLLPGEAVNRPLSAAVLLLLLLFGLYPVLRHDLFHFAWRQGREALSRGDHERGVAAFDWAERMRGGDRLLAYDVGVALYLGGDYGHALARFSLASAASDPGLKEAALYNAGNAAFKEAERKGDDAAGAAALLSLAATNYRQALELNPRAVDAKRNMELVRARR
ncbi:Aerotolerance protein BatC [Citrifermentans bremense]|uniref:Aerotolerance protein BatC n=1 Tax=Citrifermentans bremense TaxID=60035 RepID=A0A6S6M1V5_9BACT|nr:hypothetical protein [Citrifermentans bremense]BCG47618.1 Aerotolerance protein BatC [Citrifermentans bremense]